MFLGSSFCSRINVDDHAVCSFSVDTQTPVNADLALLSQTSLCKGVSAIPFKVRKAHVFRVEQERYSVARSRSAAADGSEQADRAEVRHEDVH